MHAKPVYSLANARLGVITSASLAMHASGLAQARGLLTKHAVKQVDRLLSNQGVDVWAGVVPCVPQEASHVERLPERLPAVFANITG